MITRAAQLETVSATTSFADNDSISSWAVEAISLCSGQGIMKGYPDNTINPQGYATRAEAATVIVNANLGR